MVHIGQLTAWTLQVARRNSFHDLIRSAEERGWEEYEGMEYIDLVSSRILSGKDDQWFSEHGATMELVHVPKPVPALKPHYHTGSDNIVVPYVPVGNAKLWHDRLNAWYPLFSKETLVIPSGTVHGFMPPVDSSLYLLVGSNPAIADDDTHFI